MGIPRPSTLYALLTVNAVTIIVALVISFESSQSQRRISDYPRFLKRKKCARPRRLNIYASKESPIALDRLPEIQPIRLHRAPVDPTHSSLLEAYAEYHELQSSPTDSFRPRLEVEGSTVIAKYGVQDQQFSHSSQKLWMFPFVSKLNLIHSSASHRLPM